jgi:hypothetical protein
VLLSIAGIAQDSFKSHPPLRPLPVPTERPAPEGGCYTVDPVHGDDRNDGHSRSWKTVAHALEQLKPGDTLCLRGGIYREKLSVDCRGTREQVITLRSSPGELAIIDGGLSEFFDLPETAWEPVGDGEYRSSRRYPGLRQKEKISPHVVGNFADSMVPLQGYRFVEDLRASKAQWTPGDKMSPDKAVWCGPGLWYDLESERIHVRLANADWSFLAERDRYRGETDPRRLKLVVAAGTESPLRVAGAAHVRIQDLVVRGSLAPTMTISDGESLELDGLTLYGGRSCLAVQNTRGLRVVHCAFRGLAAPWSFRSSLKYRGVECSLLNAGKYQGRNQDFEIGECEFTDSHDGIWIGNVRNIKLHHCLIENLNDDGVFLTAHEMDGQTWGGPAHLYQNLFSRCLSSLAFGVGHGKQGRLGAGVYVYRNVFDLRRPIPYRQPGEEGEDRMTPSRVWGEHGGPAWEPLFFYHNTVITRGAPYRRYFGAGLGGHTQKSTRRVFNNIFMQFEGSPGGVLPPMEHDFQAGGNLHWTARGALSQPVAAARFADPQFIRTDEDWSRAMDLRLREASPAVDAGVKIEWPDVFQEEGAPDAGAIPFGREPWRIGVRGRRVIP